MNWKQLLESSAESVNDNLRLRNDYLVAENRIFRNQIDGCVKLTDSERKELAEIGAKLGKQALAEIATVAQADTILAWHRQFANQTVNSSEPPKSVGRPRVDQEIEEWVIRMARENRTWGYDRIQGSLKHLGYTISDQTVGNILKRHGIPPAPERQKTVTWGEFIRSHWDVFVATGFFDSDLCSWFGPLISFLLSIIHFGHHLVQWVRMVLHPPKVAMQTLMRQSLELGLQMRRWVYLVAQQSHASLSEETVLDQAGSEFAFADAQQMRSQDMDTVVVLSDACSRPIHDGPSRCHQRLESVSQDNQRRAA